jgi:hypothetical protein
MFLLSEMRRMADMQTRALILMGLLPLCSAVGAGEVVNHEATLQKICTADAAKAEAFKDAHPLLKFLYEQQCASFNSKAESEQDAHQASAKTNQPLKTAEVPSSKPQDELVSASSESADSFYRLHPRVKLRNTQWVGKYEAPVVSEKNRYAVASTSDIASAREERESPAKWWEGAFVYLLHGRSSGTSATYYADGRLRPDPLVDNPVMGFNGNMSGVGAGYSWVKNKILFGISAETVGGRIRMSAPYPNHYISRIGSVQVRIGRPSEKYLGYFFVGAGAYHHRWHNPNMRPNNPSLTLYGIGVERRFADSFFGGIRVDKSSGRGQGYQTTGAAANVYQQHDFASLNGYIGYKFNP